MELPLEPLAAFSLGLRLPHLGSMAGYEDSIVKTPKQEKTEQEGTTGLKRKAINRCLFGKVAGVVQ
jgi:hypothetical protein